MSKYLQQWKKSKRRPRARDALAASESPLSTAGRRRTRSTEITSLYPAPWPGVGRSLTPSLIKAAALATKTGWSPRKAIARLKAERFADILDKQYQMSRNSWWPHGAPEIAEHTLSPKVYKAFRVLCRRTYGNNKEFTAKEFMEIIGTTSKETRDRVVRQLEKEHWAVFYTVSLGRGYGRKMGVFLPHRILRSRWKAEEKRKRAERKRLYGH